MGAPIHDWQAMLPRINELRRKGWGAKKIADDLGINVRSYGGGLQIIKRAKLPLSPITRSDGDVVILPPAIALEKVLPLLPRGLSGAKMAAEIGTKRHVVEHVIAKKLTPEQRKAWDTAKQAKKTTAQRKKVFATPVTREKNPHKRHEACVADAKEVAATFQPARRRMGEGHPAMAPGGIAWAAIWDGNPPPYPHDMMRGRFC